MPELVSPMQISEAARRAGTTASAIRYWERLGLLPVPPRQHGSRCYGPADLQRLAVLTFARENGFTLAQIRQLFCGFAEDVPAGDRWRTMAANKAAELQILIEQSSARLRRLQALTSCRCATLEECGAGMSRARQASPR